MGIILRILRPEVSLHNVYITNQFQITFAQGQEGDFEDSKEENCWVFWPNYIQELGLSVKMKTAQ